MNWGYKILTTILVFIAGMAFMVTIAMRQHNEMIDDNYYQKELEHQQLIDAEERLNRLDQPLSITQNAAGDLVFVLPKAAIGNLAEGTLQLIRPNDQRLDLHLSLSPDASGTQLIPAAHLVKGLYYLRFSWKNEGLTYYKAEQFFVQ